MHYKHVQHYNKIKLILQMEALLIVVLKLYIEQSLQLSLKLIIL